MTRPRITYAVLIIVVILLGLASRRYGQWLPGWLATNMGDALWALCVYLVYGWLRPTARIRTIAIGAGLFALAIECSQLYHAPWIDTIRNIRVFGLILGYGFLWSDLLCYTIGISVGILGEFGFREQVKKPASYR